MTDDERFISAGSLFFVGLQTGLPAVLIAFGAAESAFWILGAEAVAALCASAIVSRVFRSKKPDRVPQKPTGAMRAMLERMDIPEVDPPDRVAFRVDPEAGREIRADANAGWTIQAPPSLEKPSEL